MKWLMIPPMTGAANEAMLATVPREMASLGSMDETAVEEVGAAVEVEVVSRRAYALEATGAAKAGAAAARATTAMMVEVRMVGTSMGS